MKTTVNSWIETPRRRQPLVWILISMPLAWVYGFAVRARNFLYNRNFKKVSRLPGKVISIGNLSVGGTGKSPFVVFVAEALLSQGARPAILTRGYRCGLSKNDSAALLGGKFIISPKGGKKIFADEAQMQSAKLPTVPVVIGRDRVAAAQRYLKANPNAQPTHWILDDGFQHRRLHRDCDIVLLDEAQPFANGCVLPRGPLREKPSSLRRASVGVLMRYGEREAQFSGDAKVRVQRYMSGPIFRARIKSLSLQKVSTAASPDINIYDGVIAVCAIAKPERFFRSLEVLGIPIAKKIVFPDHKHFDIRDHLSPDDAHRHIVTTEKDYHRDPANFTGLRQPVSLLPVVIQAQEEGLADFIKRL